MQDESEGVSVARLGTTGSPKKKQEKGSCVIRNAGGSGWWTGYVKKGLEGSFFLGRYGEGQVCLNQVGQREGYCELPILLDNDAVWFWWLYTVILEERIDDDATQDSNFDALRMFTTSRHKSGLSVSAWYTQH
jgi:hypothetical protein